MSLDTPRGGRARLALAAYLRLLAACLHDEADLIEGGGEHADELLRRFREGVLALSLDDAPLDVLATQAAPDDPGVAVPGRPAPPARRRR